MNVQGPVFIFWVVADGIVLGPAFCYLDWRVSIFCYNILMPSAPKPFGEPWIFATPSATPDK